jgi:D-alanine-D-alanine ligase
LGNYKKSWSSVLFNRYPYLYLPFLEEMIPESKQQVNAICRLLKRYDIKPGTKILDFSCGIGRHSIELAKRNYVVVGYDPSEFYIRYARRWYDKDRKEKGINIDFLCGHPLKLSQHLSKHEKFDGIIVIGALGFLDDNFDISILKNIAKVAREKSVLIIEIENRDWTLNNFQECTSHRFKDIEVHERWRFNLETSVAESVSRFYQIGSNQKNLTLVLELETTLRLYSVHEMIKMLRLAGWSYLTSFESISNFEPIRHHSQDIIIVARKL